MKNRFAGFTLLEIMLAVVVTAILVSIAYPNYLSVIRKSKRSEAIEALYILQLKQEKWRATHSSYGSLGDLGLAATTPSGNYTLAVTLPSAPLDQTRYEASATAVAGTSQAKDSTGTVSCSLLKIDQSGPVFDPAGQSACWGR